MQSALRKEEPPLADVFLTMWVTPMLSANQSALSIQSVQMIKHASTTNVKTHVLVNVVSMQLVMLQTMSHSVLVILDILGMPLLPVLESQHVSFTFASFLLA